MACNSSTHTQCAKAWHSERTGRVTFAWACILQCRLNAGQCAPPRSAKATLKKKKPTKERPKEKQPKTCYHLGTFQISHTTKISTFPLTVPTENSVILALNQQLYLAKS